MATIRGLKDWWTRRQATQQADRKRCNRVDRYVREHRAEQLDRLVMRMDRGQEAALYLYPDQIVRLDGAQSDMQPLAGVTASAEQIGNHSWAGDDRQVFITIEGPAFVWALSPTMPAILVAQSTVAAREFAGHVNLAVRATASDPF